MKQSHKPGTDVAAADVSPDTLPDRLHGLFLRVAAKGWIPARWFEDRLPVPASRRAATGELELEIVSHCWQYAHLLIYQLSSLVRHPPTRLRVTMRVYYCSEDPATTRLLSRFGALDVPGVTWLWCDLPREALFRRAIGRNAAALSTHADWIWFTDCDLLFGAGCLDALADELQGRRDALVYPVAENCTPLLDPDDPLIGIDPDTAGIADVDITRFHAHRRGRATGPLQITHGDVARATGYCQALTHYQRPAARWCKAYEDRAFRWLLRSQGTPIDVPGVYRIRHAAKGRYRGNSMFSRLRGWLRRRQAAVRDRRAARER